MPKHLEKKTLDGNVETLILAQLQQGPSYGYRIIQQLNQTAPELLAFGEGTVYPVLHRLEGKGLVSSYWDASESGRKRKYYKLMAKGKRSLAANIRQWRMLQQVMEAALSELDPKSGLTS